MANPRSTPLAKGVTNIGKRNTQLLGTLSIGTLVASATTVYNLPSRFKRFYLRAIQIQFGQPATANITSIDIISGVVSSSGAQTPNGITFAAFSPSGFLANTYPFWFASVVAGQSFSGDMGGSGITYSDNLKITLTDSRPFALDNPSSGLYIGDTVPALSIVCGGGPTGNLIVNMYGSPAEEYGQ